MSRIGNNRTASRRPRSPNLRILADTILEPEYFATAQRTLDLGKDAETRWLAVWKQFRDRV